MLRHPEPLPWPSTAPALPPPAGPVHQVDTVDGLYAAAAAAAPGDTILLADGHYLLPTVFVLRTDRVTVRSASGDRDRVVLDGARSDHGELFGFTECHDAMVADLTIRNVMHNGFKLNANIGRSVRGIRIRNCVIHNIWQRGVKSVSGPVAPPATGSSTATQGCGSDWPSLPTMRACAGASWCRTTSSGGLAGPASC